MLIKIRLRSCPLHSFRWKVVTKNPRQLAPCQDSGLKGKVAGSVSSWRPSSIGSDDFCPKFFFGQMENCEIRTKIRTLFANHVKHLEMFCVMREREREREREIERESYQGLRERERGLRVSDVLYFYFLRFKQSPRNSRKRRKQPGKREESAWKSERKRKRERGRECASVHVCACVWPRERRPLPRVLRKFSCN